MPELDATGTYVDSTFNYGLCFLLMKKGNVNVDSNIVKTLDKHRSWLLLLFLWSRQVSAWLGTSSFDGPVYVFEVTEAEAWLRRLC